MASLGRQLESLHSEATTSYILLSSPDLQNEMQRADIERKVRIYSTGFTTIYIPLLLRKILA